MWKKPELIKRKVKLPKVLNGAGTSIKLTYDGIAVLSAREGGIPDLTEFTHIAIGNDNTAASQADRALGQELDRAAATVTQETTNVTDDTVRFTKAFSITETMYVYEVGVFNAATGGKMLCRAYNLALDTEHTLASGDTFTVTIDCVFQEGTH